MVNQEEQLLELIAHVEAEIQEPCRTLDKVINANHLRVLKAFQDSQIADFHLKGSTGYGYNDAGRDAVEAVYAQVLGAEKALVRGQIVSGTHAIAIALFGLLRPGDKMLSLTGRPYDTLEELIGIRGAAPGSLKELGVEFGQVDLLPCGRPDFNGIKAALRDKVKLVLIQRSRGYAWRPSLNMQQLAQIISLVKETSPDTIVFVDNCYGELVEEKEPGHVGADLVAGSLIKNLGGGLAPTGGYVAGNAVLVDLAANRLTAPGIGGEVGPSLDFNRTFLQGLFIAPLVVGEALKGAIFTACLFEKLGFPVSPKFDETRSDLIQAIKLGSPELMTEFCQAIQKSSPIDSHVRPEPWAMPGYDHKVIMAGGTFIQGATIELSADGPLREPYAIYLQGGLSKEYVKLAVITAAKEIYKLI